MSSQNTPRSAGSDDPTKRTTQARPSQSVAAPRGSALHAAAAFQWPLRVYWEDTDAGGIVFYANYLKFFERARTEWLRSLGIEQHSLKEQSGGMFVVASTSVQYLLPAKLDDELLVTAHLAEVGRASMTIFQQAYLKPNAVSLLNLELVDQTLQAIQSDTSPLLCEGSIRIGWVNSQTLQPGRIPVQILQALNNQP